MTLVLICALIGVFAGLLGGALGLGGGVVIVPPLIYLFHAMGFDGAVVAQMAVGTSLATIIVTAGSSVRAHHVAGFVRWPLAWRLAGGIVVGALLGAVVADRLSGAALTRLFGVFAVLIAAQMLLSRRRAVSAGDGLPERVPGGVGLAGVGSVIGGISSLFGANRIAALESGLCVPARGPGHRGHQFSHGAGGRTAQPPLAFGDPEAHFRRRADRDRRGIDTELTRPVPGPR
jgi:uncharacterized membrane protein YfcA